MQSDVYFQIIILYWVTFHLCMPLSRDTGADLIVLVQKPCKISIYLFLSDTKKSNRQRIPLHFANYTGEKVKTMK